MTRHIIIVCLLLFSTFYYHNSIVLRLRLPDGVMKRIDVHDNDTLANTEEGLVSLGLIRKGESKLYFRSQTLDFAKDSEKSLVRDFKASAGEVITVTSTISPPVSFEATLFNRSGNSVQLESPIKKVSTTLTSKISQAAQKTIRKRSPDRPTAGSIADIGKHRSSLVKMTREPSNTNITVRVSDSAGRILNRIAEGRICLLIGKVSKDSDRKVQNVDVLGVCELCSTKGSETVDNLCSSSTSKLIHDVRAIAKGLGLHVVGCGLGGPSMWSPTHVFTALNLCPEKLTSTDDLFTLKPPFVVLSVSHSSPDKGRRTSSTTSSSPSTTTSRNTQHHTSSGIFLEAHHLSKQALKMYRDQILPSTPISPPPPLQPAGQGRNRRPSPPSVADNTHIRLSSAVLVQSTETITIDPLLLAVPLPILPLHLPLPPSDPSGRPLFPLQLDHAFPSEEELLDPVVRTRARAHLQRTVGLKAGSKMRLRDPHLLLHLCGLVDKQSLFALCMGVAEASSAKLSSHVVVVLETLEMILTGGGSGGEGDEEEE